MTLKIVIRVANEQRMSTNKIFRPIAFTIDGHELSRLQFRVLPHFKSSSIILGLLAIKDLQFTLVQMSLL